MNEPRTFQFKILLSAAELGMLQQMTEAKGINRADFVRQLIRAEFEARASWLALAQPEEERERPRSKKKAKLATVRLTAKGKAHLAKELTR